MVIGVLIGFLAGVGTMQATLVGDVREHSTRIATVSREIDATNKSVNGRVDRITRLMESILETNRQLLSELVAERRRNDPR